MTFTKHTDCNQQKTSIIWSHVHTRKIACGARERCARCGVLFTPPVADKGIAIACGRNSLDKNHGGSLFNAEETKLFLPLLPFLWSTRLKRRKKIETNYSIPIVSIAIPTFPCLSRCRNRKCSGIFGFGFSLAFSEP